jgi:hypothetical protein
MTHPKDPKRAAKQRRYRQRRDANEIRPSIPITARVVAALIERAVTYGGLTRAEAEEASRQRDWIVKEILEVHEEVADEWL